MLKTLRDNAAFLIPYVLFLAVSGTFLLNFSKGDAHLILNQCRYDFCDYFFYLATYLGDGLAVIVMIALMCFFKYGNAAFMAISNLISSTITQTLKRTVFDDYVRPAKYFEGMANLKLHPWVDNYFYNSFPSGHTTAAFTTFFCLALVIENKWLKFLMFFTALMIGLSRVYLSQHFLNDVYAGSLIGVIITLIVFQFTIQNQKFVEMGWTQRSLLSK